MTGLVLDKKARLMLDAFHERVSAFTFDERDVFGFLVLVRDPAKAEGRKLSLLVELGDFVHRRRDGGKFHKYFCRVMDEMFRASRGGSFDFRMVKPVFAVGEFRDALNSLLALEGLGAVDLPRAATCLLCVMSILQDARFVRGGKDVGRFAIQEVGGDIELACEFTTAASPPLGKLPGGVFMRFAALSVPMKLLPSARIVELTGGIVVASASRGAVTIVPA